MAQGGGQTAQAFHFEDEPGSISAGLRVDDTDELHLGFEYVFINATPTVALRLGVWREPDHRVRNVGGDEVLVALFPPGDDEIHLSIGGGIAFRSFQIDAAVDLSDLANTTSFSVIYSF